MAKRIFEADDGRVWTVTRLGLSLEVKGERREGEKLCEIAQSCARKLGVTHLKSRVPLEYINEHRRIWIEIWRKGANP